MKRIERHTVPRFGFAYLIGFGIFVVVIGVSSIAQANSRIDQIESMAKASDTRTSHLESRIADVQHVQHQIGKALGVNLPDPKVSVK